MILDLVDEMQWEDVVEFVTLQEAGLEDVAYDTVNGTANPYFLDESGIDGIGGIEK